MLIQDLLTESAARNPEKGVVRHKSEWMSYEDLDYQSDRLAGFLADQGISPGDRVAIVAENSFEYVVSYFGVLKAGGVTVELNVSTPSEGLTQLLNHSDSRAVICTKKYFRTVIPALHSAPGVELFISDSTIPMQLTDKLNRPAHRLQGICLSEAYKRPSIGRIDVDLASIVYTSGSTGTPKGVMHSHLNVVTNTHSIIEYLELTSNDRVMVILPFYYVYGKTLLTTHIAVGGSLVIDNRFAYPNVVLETMVETGVTGFAGVPSTYSILMGKSGITRYTFPKLRYVTQAGGHMAVGLQKEVAEVFSPAKLFVMYGATELSPRLTYVPPDTLADKWGSIGVPIPNTEAFIADEYGNRLERGRDGEIVGRGANVMMGYWKDAEGTARVLRNGLYYTGDIGREDEDGYLYVTGRTKEMMKVKGNRVSAKEIEDALLGVGDVQEAAVVSVPDEILGEAPWAYVVPRKGHILQEDNLRAALLGSLAAYKIPKEIIVTDMLPKNESGKILKQMLKGREETDTAGSLSI